MGEKRITRYLTLPMQPPIERVGDDDDEGEHDDMLRFDDADVKTTQPGYAVVERSPARLAYTAWLVHV